MRTILALLLFAATAFGADPFLGSWRLNPAKSKFDGEPAPAELTVTWSASHGLRVSGEGVSAEGRQIRYRYDPVYDGKEYPPKGPWDWDTVANQQVDDHIREDTYRKDGRVIRIERRTVTADGKTMTYSIRAESPQGPRTSTMVFDRVN